MYIADIFIRIHSIDLQLFNKSNTKYKTCNYVRHLQVCYLERQWCYQDNQSNYKVKPSLDSVVPLCQNSDFLDRCLRNMIHLQHNAIDEYPKNSRLWLSICMSQFSLPVNNTNVFIINVNLKSFLSRANQIDLLGKRE